MTVAELVQQIERAFAGVALENGVGLFESQALDDRLEPEQCAAVRARDEKSDWHTIAVLDLYRCSTCLSFFDAKGMRFHLPQIMLFSLGVYAEEHERLTRQGVLKHMDAPDLHWHLTKPDMFDYYFSALSAEQVACVISFLEHIRDTALEGTRQDNPEGLYAIFKAQEAMRQDLDQVEKALPVWRERMNHLEMSRKPRRGKRQKPGR